MHTIFRVKVQLFFEILATDRLFYLLFEVAKYTRYYIIICRKLFLLLKKLVFFDSPRQ